MFLFTVFFHIVSSADGKCNVSMIVGTNVRHFEFDSPKTIRALILLKIVFL